jgi:hypothetical protein
MADDLLAGQVMQAAIQQPGHHINPDLVHRRPVPGTPHGLREQVDALHRGLSLRRGQPAGRQHRGPGVVQPRAHAAVPQGFAVAPLVIRRGDAGDHPAQPHRQLPGVRRPATGTHRAHTMICAGVSPEQCRANTRTLGRSISPAQERRVHRGQLEHDLLGEIGFRRPRPAATTPTPPAPHRPNAGTGAPAGRPRCRQRSAWPAPPRPAPPTSERPRARTAATARPAAQAESCSAPSSGRPRRARRPAPAPTEGPPAPRPHQPPLLPWLEHTFDHRPFWGGPATPRPVTSAINQRFGSTGSTDGVARPRPLRNRQDVTQPAMVNVTTIYGWSSGQRRMGFPARGEAVRRPNGDGWPLTRFTS